MILVPQNKKCRAVSGETEAAPRSMARSTSSVAGSFETGTDSPSTVSLLALSHQHRWPIPSLTGQHALVDNAVSTEKQSIAWKLCQIWVAELVNVSRNQVAR